MYRKAAIFVFVLILLAGITTYYLYQGSQEGSIVKVIRFVEDTKFQNNIHGFSIELHSIKDKVLPDKNIRNIWVTNELLKSPDYLRAIRSYLDDGFSIIIESSQLDAQAIYNKLGIETQYRATKTDSVLLEKSTKISKIGLMIFKNKDFYYIANINSDGSGSTRSYYESILNTFKIDKSTMVY